MKKIHENVFRFRTMLIFIWSTFMFLIMLILVFGFDKLISYYFKSMVGMIILDFMLFVWLRVEIQGIVLDLNKRIIKLKANYLTALLTPFGRFKQKTINLDEIIGVSLNVDVDISSNNNITKFYSVNITGAFGANNISFLTRENAQSLYSMIITACNLH